MAVEGYVVVLCYFKGLTEFRVRRPVQRTDIFRSHRSDVRDRSHRIREEDIVLREISSLVVAELEVSSQRVMRQDRGHVAVVVRDLHTILVPHVTRQTCEVIHGYVHHEDEIHILLCGQDIVQVSSPPRSYVGVYEELGRGS